MPVYFFTFHAYRSWRANHPKGYVQRDNPGVLGPNTNLSEHREASANNDAVLFTRQQQHVLIDAAKDICGRRDWTLYAMAATATHVHVLLGWNDDPPVDLHRDRLKSLLGKALSDYAGSTGNRWFSRGQHTEKVVNKKHLETLVRRYVPKHSIEGGLVYIKLWGETYEG